MTQIEELHARYNVLHRMGADMVRMAEHREYRIREAIAAETQAANAEKRAGRAVADDAGNLYASARAAQVALGLRDDSAITRAIHRGGSYCGRRWRFADSGFVKPRHESRNGEVRDVETGETWPSVDAFASAFGVTRNAVVKAFGKKRRVAGRKVEHVPPPLIMVAA